MPKYAKFLREVLSNKRRLEANEKVMLMEECSAILQRKLPPTLKDPGSFTIPCTIGDFEFDKVLCDLGASINLMPLSIFKKLGLGEVKPTTVSLQLADRSIKHPRGIIEDVLVKVDKFIFPADFIVLDMEEDREVPLILGRPFLATGRTLIDVHQGKLILRVQDEQVTFNVFEAMKFPSDVHACFEISVLDRSMHRLSECHFMVREGIVLGHRISVKGIEVDRAKIDVIEKLPPPTNGIKETLMRNFQMSSFCQWKKPLGMRIWSTTWQGVYHPMSLPTKEKRNSSRVSSITYGMIRSSLRYVQIG
ncbi:hypothetical protein UlMin_028415 [Ulmus minor]